MMRSKQQKVAPAPPQPIPLSDPSEEARFRLAAIVESSNDAIISKNLNGIITSWNRGAEHIFEYSEAEVLGKPITIIIPPDLIYQETEILRRIRAGQRVESFETVRLAKSGRQVNVSLTISPVRNSEGRIIGASKIARDITDRVHVEAALRDSENRLRLAQSAAHIGSWEWSPGQNANSLSPELMEMFGLNSSDPDHQATWFTRVFADDLPVVRRAMADAPRTGTMEFEYRFLHPQKGLRWFFCKGSRLAENIEGAPMFGVVMDITDRKRAAEALRLSEQQFRDLADSIQQLVWIAEADGFIFWYNQRWFDYTGTTHQQVAGWDWQSVHHPDHLPKVMERWKQCLASGEPFEMEFPLRGADGVYRWFLTRANPVRDAQGNIWRWFGTNTNIHEQREITHALQAGQQQLNSVLAALTKANDELETRVRERTADLQRAEENLRALSGRLLQAQDDERRRIARELHDSAGQLLAALNMNLVPIQADAGKLTPAAATAVNESIHLVEELSKELRTISHLLHPPMLDEAGLEFALQWYVEGFADRSNIDVDFHLAEDLGRLPRDMETAIFRLIQESLTNIHRHANSPVASLSVLRNAENQIVVEVRDEGKGMSTSVGNGHGPVKTGVGIQGMRERVRQLGGKLEIESSSAGTTVRAILPLPVGSTQSAY